MDKIEKLFKDNPVRAVAGLLVVILVVLSSFGVIDANTVETVVGSFTLILGGELARSQVKPKAK